jgi:hypothetical protein
LPVIESGRLQALESRGKIDQPAARREIDHPQRAGYGRPCRRATVTPS